MPIHISEYLTKKAHRKGELESNEIGYLWGRRVKARVVRMKEGMRNEISLGYLFVHF